LVAVADGGTLFIDEVTDLPPVVQMELVRVLDRGEVIPVGGSSPHPVMMRLVAATATDPLHLAKSTRLDSRLMGGLSVISIPPLRDRISDIPDLAEECLGELGVKHPVFSLETLAELRSRSWPGNVAELRDALTCAYQMAAGAPLRPEHFPQPTTDLPSIQTRLREAVEAWVQVRASAAGGPPAQLHRDLVSEIEQALLGEILRYCGGCLMPAARKLGLARMTLRGLVKRHFPMWRHAEPNTSSDHCDIQVKIYKRVDGKLELLEKRDFATSEYDQASLYYWEVKSRRGYDATWSGPCGRTPRFVTMSGTWIKRAEDLLETHEDAAEEASDTL
jgi:DNA-binding NtrC family response regulator